MQNGPRKIALVTASESGGLRSVTLNLADSCIGLGLEPHVVTIATRVMDPRPPTPVALGHLRAWRVETRRPGLLLLTHRFAGLHRAVAGCDAVIVLSGCAALAMSFFGHGLPVFHWAVATLDRDLSGRLRSFPPAKQLAYRTLLPRIRARERAALQRFEHVWALSPAVARDVEQIAPSTSKRMTVLMPPIDTELFCPDEKGPPAPGVTVMFVGRILDKRKDVAMLLRAFARARAKVSELKLLLVGNGSTDGELEEQLRFLDIADAVEVLADQPRSGLPSAYHRANIFALPSRHEGLCLTAVEAMACGLPVVATRCGGPEAYVEHEVNGILVDVGDDAAMTSALVRLAREPGLRVRLGLAARRTVVATFTEPRFRDVLEPILCETSPVKAAS